MILSHEISDNTPTYGNNGNVEISNTSTIEINGARSMNINMPNHISTHIDFPSHFCIDGKTLSDYHDDFWFFDKIGFLECSLENLDSKLHLLNRNIEILIVKTQFEKCRNTEEYTMSQPTFEENLSYKLREYFPNLRVFGFDMISISSYKNRPSGRISHRLFLCENEILLLEDMKLSSLFIAPSELVIAPLLIKDSDGSPCFVYAKVGT